MTPTDIRRIVAEAVKRGCRVKVEPDGTVEITPPPVQHDPSHDLSLIDFRR